MLLFSLLPLLTAAAAADATIARLLNVQQLVTAEDYPLISLRNGEQGEVTVRVKVDPNGIVAACKIAKSSGHQALDDQTCALFRARARFAPATDRHGHATSSDFTQKIVWKLAGTAPQQRPRQAWMMRTTVALSKQGQIVDCKIESAGMTPPPPDCEILLAAVRALPGADGKGAQPAAFTITEVYFYPVEVAKAPDAPSLADAKQIARQVSKVIVAPDGRVRACEGIRYSGGASPQSDACKIINLEQFEPVSQDSKDLSGTYVVTAYVRTETIT